MLLFDSMLVRMLKSILSQIFPGLNMPLMILYLGYYYRKNLVLKN